MTKPILPAGVFEQHQIVLGKTRSGKSSVMRGMVESLLDDERPVTIIDPKGDWWGLKSSADGKREGYPVIIFGGEHADVPLNAHAGAHVAELVATGNRPCIIDLGGWMVGERTRFYIEFASNLFKLTRGRRWLVIDECHNFCPKGKIMDPDAGKMLHWSNRLASEGLGKGLHLIAASQRPQKVHNDFLTSCETIIAMKVIHARDRESIAEWIDGCADPAIGKEVLKGLAQLKRGSGWVWSPEIGFGPQQVAFPLFRTYDSFKPQSERAARLKGWAAVDLDDVKAKLAVVVKEAEANDPKKLRADLAKVTRERDEALKSAGKKGTAATPKALPGPRRVDVETITALRKALGAAMKFIVEINMKGLAKLGEGIDQAAIEKAITAAAETIKRQIEGGLSQRNREFERLKQQGERTVAALEKLLKDDVRLSVDVRESEPFTVTPARVPNAPRAPRGNGASDAMSKSARAILTALAQRQGQNSTRGQLAVLSGYSVTSSTFANGMSELRVSGWLNGSGDQNAITDAGLQALGSYDPLPTGEGLQQYWFGRLSLSERTMLTAICGAYPKAISKEELGAQTGYSETSSTFANALSGLRVRELITRGEIKASDNLF